MKMETQPNHYQGDCERPGCRQRVRIGEGIVVSYYPGDRWNLYHHPGQCPPPPAPAPARPMRRLDCGHESVEAMTTAHGLACPDCYDAMSD